MKLRFIKVPHVAWIFSGLFLGIGLSITNAYARTQFIPEISLSESFLQNETATLDETGQVTEISPGIAFNYTQARLDLSLAYRVNAVINSGLQAEDHENQSLDLSTLINHKPNQWDTLITAKVGQANTSTDGIQVVNPINDSSNTQEIRLLSFLTTYQGRLGGDVDFRTGLSMDYADVETEDKTDSIGLNLDINNNRTQNRLKWNVALNSRKFGASDETVSNNSLTDDQIDTLQAGISYRFNRKFSTYLSAEKSDTTNENLNKTNSSAGILWVPNVNTSIKLGAGARGSDESWFLDSVIIKRRLEFAANYEEGVTTSRSLVFDENTIQPGLVTTSQSLSITPVLLKKGTVSLTSTGRRTDLTFAYFNESRNQQNTNSEEEQSEGLSISALRNLSRLSNIEFSISHRDTQTTQKNTLKDVKLIYARELSQQVDFSTELRNTEQDSNVAENVYQQNILSFRLKATF